MPVTLHGTQVCKECHGRGERRYFVKKMLHPVWLVDPQSEFKKPALETEWRTCHACKGEGRRSWKQWLSRPKVQLAAK